MPVDGAGTEARKMPRRSGRNDHFCTGEVAAPCLALAGDTRAASALAACLDVFTPHDVQARQRWPVQRCSPAHQALQPYCMPLAP